jgi:hypothetical protein
MPNIDIKQSVDKIADGTIDTNDANFITSQMDLINKDKIKNHFQEFITTNKVNYEQAKNCISESLNTYLNSKQCDEKVLPQVQEFIKKLENEHNIINTPPTTRLETSSSTPSSDIETYNANAPLDSMLQSINNNLKKSGLESKKITQTADQIRENLK